LRYAKITIDKITNRSKGNGFICFYNVEDADSCLNEYEQACQSFYDANSAVEQGKSHIVPEAPVVESHSISKFTLDGRFLNVGAAVSKIIAQDLSYNGKVKKRASDKRNLYLMREGAIFPDTDAAEHLKPEELKRRTDGFAERKRILATNPNLFISKFRLSFRAISKNLTDIELKNTAKHAVIKFWREVERGERAALEREVMEEEEKMGLETPCSARKIGIKQAKILKDKDRLDAVTKKPKSKGIGFVEFDSHADALACLRMLNNNPEAFLNPKKDNSAAKTVDKRPIVEFAIENKLVLKQRAERAKGFEQKRKRQEESSEKGTRKKFKSQKDDEKTTKSKMSYKDRMLLRKEKRKAKKTATEKVETPSPEPPKQKQDAKPKKQDKLKKDGEFENQVLNLKQKLFGKKE
jgi:nucleolar protein 4